MTASMSPSPMSPTVGQVLRDFPQWLKKNVPSAVVSAVIGGIFGYAVNIWLMAVRYNGWQKVPKGSPATAQGTFDPSTFPVLDLMFGTFYMPKNELPDVYGVADPAFPPTFGEQMLYPFRQ